MFSKGHIHVILDPGHFMARLRPNCTGIFHHSISHLYHRMGFLFIHSNRRINTYHNCISERSETHPEIYALILEPLHDISRPLLRSGEHLSQYGWAKCSTFRVC